MNKALKYSLLGLGSALLVTGCSYKNISTPVVMSYDGSNVDYSKIDTLKKSEVCKKLADANGNDSVITAAKKAGISKIKHVDTAYTQKQFLFWTYDREVCVTVYGE